jgi:D-alanyl-D-alanine dipeptidase
MSQQLQQPPVAETGTQQYQPSYQAQTQVGQQLQESRAGQFIGQRFQESVPLEVQQAVSDLDRFETVLEWAKSQATMRGRPRVAARCDDLAEIAHLEKKLLLRQSPFAQPIGQATQQTIQQGIQELQHRAGEPEVQEALQHGQQVVNSIGQAMSRVQAWGQQGVQQQGLQPQTFQQGMQQPYQG